ncbi:hypothetical protein [Jiella avicenniae]|uniref:Uncharacterized protein n=1 Tax=Jiella avicenniae TaxID=2907202 RepID=A0A9X1P6Y4_9HYPH|nr:hypothetical protein [Jiella avicenniae]MCE7030949.1 hypothetical protein [Jiella avicenniae]
MSNYQHEKLHHSSRPGPGRRNGVQSQILGTNDGAVPLRSDGDQLAESGPVEPAMAYVMKLAETIVTSAMAAAEAVEPDATLGLFSTLASAFRSVITRVGQSIPDVVAECLRQDARFTVLREYALPLTQPATEVVDTNRSTPDLELRHDQYVTGSYRCDLVVIDNETRHATILECRRGTVAVSSVKATEAVRLLRIAGLTARRALEAKNYRVASVSCGFLDRYGRADYDRSMTVGPKDLDDFFGMPVLTCLDELDMQIRERLAVELRTIIAVILAELSPGDPDQGPAPVSCGADGDDADENKLDLSIRMPSSPSIDLSRLVGPAELRRAAQAPRHAVRNRLS